MNNSSKGHCRCSSSAELEGIVTRIRVVKQQRLQMDYKACAYQGAGGLCGRRVVRVHYSQEQYTTDFSVQLV
jgi:hypothetical protein